MRSCIIFLGLMIWSAMGYWPDSVLPIIVVFTMQIAAGAMDVAEAINAERKKDKHETYKND